MIRKNRFCVAFELQNLTTQPPFPFLTFYVFNAFHPSLVFPFLPFFSSYSRARRASRASRFSFSFFHPSPCVLRDPSSTNRASDKGSFLLFSARNKKPLGSARRSARGFLWPYQFWLHQFWLYQYIGAGCFGTL